MLKKGVCYKQKFYGVPTHRCMQFSPAALFCQNNCVYCWRPAEYMQPPKNPDWDSPAEIVENLVSLRQKLLFGFKGNPEADNQLVKQALEPVHFAISLSGEPTLYPFLPEMVRYLLDREGTFSVFVVSNGQEPQVLQELADSNSLPTQLYISLTAPSKELYRRVSAPSYPDAWERIMKSLMMLRGLDTRTVLRLTLIKGLNMGYEPDWARMIQMADPDFVELKAYMHIGYSQRRLKRENMPEFSEIEGFGSRLLEFLPGFARVSADEPSRIVLLQNKTSRFPLKISSPRNNHDAFKLE